MRHTVYLGLGTNLGDKEENIYKAIEHIEELIGTVVCQSALYDTAPWGFQSDNRFINAAVRVETKCSPRQVLELSQRIEQKMGRTRKSHDGAYDDRIIDIDILKYDDVTIDDDDLKVPHPLIKEREFVMKPLGDIMSDSEFSALMLS